MDSGLTRAQLLRRAAAGGAGLVLAGGGAAAAYRLLEGDGEASLLAPAAPRPSETSGRVQRFVSRPDLKPPTMTVVKPAVDVAPGYVFLGPSSGPGQRGAMIVDNAGDLVWFHPTKRPVMNLRAAVYKGQPVLTWWEGKTEHGLGIGTHVVVDGSYREIARFPAGGGLAADLHELVLTPAGTAIVTAWELRRLNVPGHGRRHPVVGGVVQELEVPSARVLFQWRSLDHVALAESHAKVGPRWDYFHVNSVDVAPDGNLIVSARNTWTIYKVNRRTGAIMWRLGGKKSDFRMGRGTVFAWQHDARSHGDGDRLTIFDNGAAPQVEPQSRGLAVALDTPRRRATLVHRYVHRPQPLLSHFMGSVQMLPNGNAMVGWGAEPYLTEFAADGSIRFDAKLPRGGESYRALRFPWTGRPSDAPRLAAAGSTLYASWNGATEVASWELRTGSAAASLQRALEVPKRGFETAFAAPRGATYAAVVALDRGGRPLGTSPTIRL